jgi:transcription antitermination factor NusG
VLFGLTRQSTELSRCAENPKEEETLRIQDGEAMSPNSPTMNERWQPGNAEVQMWFAVYVTSRHEKKVQTQLVQQKIETFLPLYTTVHCWKNRCRKVLQLPLFPNYLFVHIPLSTRFAVLRTPGVTSLVCSGHLPVPLPSAAIEAIRAALAVREVEPHPYLAVGNRVRIIDGPLLGMAGVLVKKKNKLRVVLLLDEIRQSAAVEVNADEIDNVAPVPLDYVA